MADENMHPFEGCLMKYTNVVKGWQYRFFILDPVRGVLEYYVSETDRKESGPRGVAHLRNATVLPSSDDSQTFVVTFRGGETFKLKARDSRERQIWIDRLRVASLFAPSTAQLAAPVMESSLGEASNTGCSASVSSLAGCSNSAGQVPVGGAVAVNLKRSVNAALVRSSLKSDRSAARSKPQPTAEQAISTTDDPFLDVQTKIRAVRDQRNGILAALSDFPRHSNASLSGDEPQLDRNARQLLSIQACSLATIETLEQCLKSLQQPAASTHHHYITQKSRHQFIQTPANASTTTETSAHRSRSSTRSVSPVPRHAAEHEESGVPPMIAGENNSMGNLPTKGAQSLQSAIHAAAHYRSHNDSSSSSAQQRSPVHGSGSAREQPTITIVSTKSSRRARTPEVGSGAAVTAASEPAQQSQPYGSPLQQEDSDTLFENFYSRSLRKVGGDKAATAAGADERAGQPELHANVVGEPLHTGVAAGDQRTNASFASNDAVPRDAEPAVDSFQGRPVSPLHASSPQRTNQKDEFFTPSDAATPDDARFNMVNTRMVPHTVPNNATRFTNLLSDRIENDEVSDNDAVKDEEDLGSVEGQKSVIMHLLGQLRIGMDLTKVVLPTFILERRSLLEMFADYMAHAHMLLRVTDLPQPKDRMIAVLEWYLTSFHACRKGSIAKKPYNPVIGEQFHCSWHVPRAKIQKATNDYLETVRRSPKAPRAAGSDNNADYVSVRYCGEQVSHHPPITAFFIDCPEKGLQANAAIYTKSKFMGLSIGVSMVGNCILFLREHGEEYTFGLPSAYARSILTVPWTELGGKLEIDCQQTGLVSEINFHTKPFYGGKLHRVTAEVRDRKQNKILCTVEGEWDKFFKFTFVNEKVTKQIDVDTLEFMHKRVRSTDNQSPNESRRLWRHVTLNLETGDIEAATEYKKALEERQRGEEKARREKGVKYDPKYFKEVGEVDYRFRDLLR